MIKKVLKKGDVLSKKGRKILERDILGLFLFVFLILFLSFMNLYAMTEVQKLYQSKEIVGDFMDYYHTIVDDHKMLVLVNDLDEFDTRADLIRSKLSNGDDNSVFISSLISNFELNFILTENIAEFSNYSEQLIATERSYLVRKPENIEIVSLRELAELDRISNDIGDIGYAINAHLQFRNEMIIKSVYLLITIATLIPICVIIIFRRDILGK